METNLKKLIKEISKLPQGEKIKKLNKIKLELHKISPFKNEPVDCVLWIKGDFIKANDYNPNSVAPPEMELLRVSISNDGFTQPIVSVFENKNYTVIDGFHRNRVGKECEEINKKVLGYLPITTIRPTREGRNNRIASTIRHNRARGKHSIDGMCEIIVELKRRNWTNKKIARELGMDADEILRLSQITGLADMFKDKEFSEAWEADVINEEDTLETEFEDVKEKKLKPKEAEKYD